MAKGSQFATANHQKNIIILLCLLIACVALFRVIYANASPYLSDDASYQQLREIELYRQNPGKVLIDPLSFQGREIIVHPIATGILSFFYAQQNPLAYYKTFLNLSSVLLTILLFLIAKQCVTNPYYALATALIGSFIPLHYLATLNTINILPFVLLSSLLAIYFYQSYVRTKRKMTFAMAAILFVVSSLLHPLFIVILLGFLLSFIFSLTKDQPVMPFSFELVLASLLSSFAANYIIYYQSFVEHGVSVFWQQTQFISSIHLNQIIPLLPQMGLFIFVIAMYVIYTAFDLPSELYETKKPSDSHNLNSPAAIALRGVLANIDFVLLSAGVILTSVVLMIFRFLPSDQGLLLISLFCVLILPIFLQRVDDYLSQTKISVYKYVFTIAIILFLVVSNVVATILYTRQIVDGAPSEQFVDSLIWISSNTPSNALIIVPISLAQTAMYYSSRSTIVDANTLLAPNPTRAYLTLESMYKTPYMSQLISELASVGASRERPAILVSQTSSADKMSYEKSRSVKAFNRAALRDACFIQIYSVPQVSIYQSLCEASS